MVITALGSEEINKKIKEKSNVEIYGTDIQYQEALLEIIEKNKEINFLILSSLLPGELNIYELINIIKYKNPKLEIIIILEEKNDKLIEFLILKGINNIFYNNKITINEILEKIEKNNFKKITINNQIIKKEFNKINFIGNKIEKINIIKNKIKNIFKIKKEKRKNNKKIISIIGTNKIGKTIFSIILSLNIKNKKILLINLDFSKNDIKIITGKTNNIKNRNIMWKKNIQIMDINKRDFENKKLKDRQKAKEFFRYIGKDFDYIIIDVGDIKEKENIINISDENIVLVEATILGLKETRDILKILVQQFKNQTDNIKIVFNKQTKCSISKPILKTIFSDFKILGELKYNEFYNIFINTNMKFGNKNIDKEYKKIIKKIV